MAQPQSHQVPDLELGGASVVHRRNVGHVGAAEDGAKVVAGVRQVEPGQGNALRRKLWSWGLLRDELHIVTTLQGLPALGQGKQVGRLLTPRWYQPIGQDS